MPLTDHRRLRKQWRYVGVFGERLMLCAGVVRIGPVRQAFWAVWDRERLALRERTRLGPRASRHVSVGPGRVTIADGAVAAELIVEPGVAVETASPAGPSWIWTRKQGGVRVRGRVALEDERIAVDALGCVDESAGYHDRETAWQWSAGVGRLTDGRTAAWNLVSGIHDDPVASERTVWIDGEPSQVGRVAFADDLTSIAFAEDGAALRFTPEAVRRRRDDAVLLRSDYVQPFGTFIGTLPGRLALAEGRGVMERHAARW